jgi:hypothetical protein
MPDGPADVGAMRSRALLSVLAITLLWNGVTSAAASPSAISSAGQSSVGHSIPRAKCRKPKRHRARRPGVGRRACRRAKSPGPAVDAGQSPSQNEPGPGVVTPSQLSSPEPPLVPASETSGHFRFFSSTSFWNTPVASNAALDPSSQQLAKAFNTEISRELTAEEGPGISTTAYSVPIYKVPTDQPNKRVRLMSATSAPALQAAWSEVPIPPGAHPAAGTDGALVVWQPGNDRLWEFWRAVHTEEGWQASWGGAIQNVSANPGVYGTDAWPGAKPWWGSSASSLSIAGGLITFEDLQHGQINHALALAIPNVRAGVYASPAQRTDGKSTSPLALPEGVHLRLDPNLDLSSLSMPPITRMIAEAAQRYGIFVRDGAHVVHFFAEDPVTLASNPYVGTNGYFEGQLPGKLLGSFPWSHLEVLRMELHSAN